MLDDELRVLVVADNPLTRAGLVSILENQAGCRVVGQVDSTWMEQAGMYEPAVVVWDMDWDQEPLVSDFPLAVLIPDEGHAAAARGAGARGIFLRQIDAEALGAGLRAIVRGLFVIDPVLVDRLAVVQEATNELSETLTPRELEVLHLLAEGLSNKLVAQRLGISDHTVKFHVNAIMGKLNAQSRTEAVVRATRLGLISL